MQKNIVPNEKQKPPIPDRIRQKKRRKAFAPKPETIRVSNFLDYRQQLLQKFRQFTRTQTCNNFKNAMLTLIGRHTPVAYQSKYFFKEQWEMVNHRVHDDGYSISTASTSISVIRMVLFAFCMWGLSIAVFFPLLDDLWVKILLMVISCTELLKYSISLPRMTTIQKISQLLKLLLTLTYSLTLLIFPQHFQTTSWGSRVLATTIILTIYTKLSKIYTSIKNYHISSQYRDIVNLFDLFVLLIAITHIFGCVLFITAELSVEENWVGKIGIQDSGWVEKYIYSLYFSATTLLTVGYGDIAPTNVKEVSAILVTEFIGIAIFGYAVNKIGAALSNMQQKSQKLQKDLGTVQNFGKNCRLQPSVICKMRTEVINNKRLDEDLCLKDENQLLQNFSEDLRQKIQIESGLQVIKNSVFMIVNWTGKFQSKVAEKLVKEVYKAEETLPQSFGKEKLYILDKGRIDIMNCSKSYFQKVLKSLKVQGNDEVILQNVYGYSAVISSRNINLNAIAKKTSICYTLAKSDFFQILEQCQIDREHYHQIKSKIDFARIPEQLQTPSIVNIRQHYLPSTVHIITKNRHKKPSKNPRQPSQRTKTRSKLFLNQQQLKDLHLKQQLSIPSYGNIKQNQLTRIENISYNAQLVSMECGFECYKIYQKFFKKANIDGVIQRLAMIRVNRRSKREVAD